MEVGSARQGPAAEGQRFAPWQEGWVETHSSLPSTNDRARALALAGAPEGTWVLAEAQTDGRGQRGRPWWSPPGLGLWCSLVLRPSLHPGECPRLVVWAALGVARTVSSFLGAPAGIKWPNDVLVAGRKVAGILVETETAGSAVRFVIVGIGVNVNQRDEDFPPELRGRATYYGQHAEALGLTGGGPPLCLQDVFRTLRVELGRLYEEEVPGRLHGVVGRVRPYSVTLGRRVRLTVAGREVEGVAVDFSPEGMLVVRDDAGRTHIAHSGDLHQEEPLHVRGA